MFTELGPCQWGCVFMYMCLLMCMGSCIRVWVRVGLSCVQYYNIVLLYPYLLHYDYPMRQTEACFSTSVYAPGSQYKTYIKSVEMMGRAT